MVTTRGSLHWVDLGQVRGSTPAKRRPVLVVQSNPFIASALATVIVAVVTSNTRLAEVPGNVFVPASASDLPKDSAVVVSQLVTLDKDSLGALIGVVPSYLMSEVDAGLRLSLAV